MLNNPFFVYVLSFVAVLAIYQLGWSDVYPSIPGPLLAFLGATMVVAIVLGLAFRSTVEGIRNHGAGLIRDWAIFPLVLLFCADLAANGLPPFVQIAMGTFNHKLDFGIPHVHPIVVTFGCSFSTIRFADFLASGRKRYLLEATLPFIYLLLTMYRGPIMITLVSWVFVYLIESRLTLKKVGALAGMTFVALFLFGVVGQFREGTGSISRIGHASHAFEETGLPEVVFWTYLYATSPTANLALTLEKGSDINQPTREFLASELLPDVISKRLMRNDRVATPEISHGLNVATMYGRSAVFDGLVGMSVIFCWFCFVVAAYVLITNRTPLAVPSLALLNTVVVFSTFQNMIAYSGLFLQLVWPVVLSLMLYRTSTKPIYKPIDGGD